MQSPTLHALACLQETVEALKTQGVDPVFIQAAIAQLFADFQTEAEASIKAG